MSYSNIEKLLRKLARPAQKVGNKRIRFPWRQRKARNTGAKLTDAEKRALKARREAKRENIEDALKAARETMYKFAEAMSSQFGGHDADYYYALIMQRSRLKGAPRKLCDWNVFVSQETKRRNDGMSQLQYYERCYIDRYPQNKARTTVGSASPNTSRS